MKVILLVYHKSVFSIYKKEWIDKFRDSILNQTYTDFEIMEINYGGGTERIFETSVYESKELPTFIHAMNYLIDKALINGADAICNSNVDDHFSFDRLQVQLPFIESGFDIVTSNFCLVQNDTIVKFHDFDEMDIKYELSINHNPVAHPSVIYSKKFLENNRYIPEDFPEEDMRLWERTIDNYRFKIVPENLLFHRLHNQSVCQSSNR